MKTFIKFNFALPSILVIVAMFASCTKEDLTPATSAANSAGFNEHYTFYNEPEQLQHRQSVDQNASSNQDSNYVALNSVQKIEGK